MFSSQLMCDGNLKLRDLFNGNGLEGKYNLNRRLVKQKPQKTDSLAFAIVILFSNLLYLIDIMATVLLVSGLGLPYTITKLPFRVLLIAVILSQKSSSCSRRNTNAVSVLLTGY